MSNLKTEFYNIIKLNKPNISESSIEMYSNCIKTFYLQNTKYKTINKKWFLKLKESLSCCVCGESETSCLDFHHINSNEKEFDI